jgi:hypothetical protein
VSPELTKAVEEARVAVAALTEAAESEKRERQAWRDLQSMDARFVADADALAYLQHQRAMHKTFDTMAGHWDHVAKVRSLTHKKLKEAARLFLREVNLPEELP